MNMKTLLPLVYLKKKYAYIQTYEAISRIKAPLNSVSSRPNEPRHSSAATAGIPLYKVYQKSPSHATEFNRSFESRAAHRRTTHTHTKIKHEKYTPQK